LAKRLTKKLHTGGLLGRAYMEIIYQPRDGPISSALFVLFHLCINIGYIFLALFLKLLFVLYVKWKPKYLPIEI